MVSRFRLVSWLALVASMSPMVVHAQSHDDPERARLDSLARAVSEPGDSSEEAESPLSTRRSTSGEGPAFAHIGWTTTAASGSGPRFRLRLEAGTRTLRVRADAEQDPGEPWEFRPLGGRWGFDHTGAFVEWTPSRSVSVVVGDYRLSSLLGLLVAAPRMGRAGDDLFGVSRTGDRRSGDGPVDPYSGSDEDRYLSGAAFRVRLKGWSLSLFGSVRRPDASLETIPGPDSLTLEVARLRPGQDHSTDLGRSRRGLLRLLSRGVALGWAGGSLDLAGLVFEESATPSLLPTARVPVDAFARRLQGSAHARIRGRRAVLSAEGAWIDGLNAGVLFIRTKGYSVSWLVGIRRFDPEYAPLAASAPSFRSGAPGNERGASIAAQWRLPAGGPYRAALDRGCRIRAEATYARGGCRETVRLDARWTRSSLKADLFVVWERYRSPDVAARRGEQTARGVLSGTIEAPVTDRVVATLTASVRRVMPASQSLAGEPRPDPGWSTKAAVRVRWRPSTALDLEAGVADFHVSESVLGLYETAVPLMTSVRTLSGDGIGMFATIRRNGPRAGWGLTVRRRRSRPVPPAPGVRGTVDLDVGIHIRISLAGAALSARP